jgi:hypothetical protein
MAHELELEALETERLQQQMQEELAEEAREMADSLPIASPFDPEWEFLPDEEKAKYYRAQGERFYAEWCKNNPLPKRKRQEIIETHLPANQVHILCGESGAQKTSILLTLLNEWRQGHEVLSKQSFPVPMMFFAYDRGSGTAETFENLGLDYRLFGYYKMSREDFDIPLEQLIRRLKKENPTVGLFVVDSMFIGSPDELRYYGKKGEVVVKDPYKVTARWLRELDFMCEELGITIIGLHHAGKHTGGEHGGKRTRALGTVAIGATTGTTIIADLVDSPNPTLPRTRWVIRPRNAAVEEFYFDRQPDGSMKQVDPEIEHEAAFEKFMEQGDGTYTRVDIEDKTGLTKGTVTRYINRAVKDGRLRIQGKGKATTYLRKHE